MQRTGQWVTVSVPRPVITCRCGCGEIVPQPDGRGRSRVWVPGHKPEREPKENESRPVQVSKPARRCACGCGIDITSQRYARGYAPGHCPTDRHEAIRRERAQQLRDSVALCGCGCGTTISTGDRRKYAKGHRRKARTKREREHPERKAREQRRVYVESVRVWRRILEADLAQRGVLTSKARGSLKRVLEHVWRRVTSWCEFALCPTGIDVCADPCTMTQNLIYGLVDPRTKLVRYVGLSTTGMKRPQQHRRPATNVQKYHSARWVAELKECGLTYEIVILESGSDSYEDLCASERWWIAYGRASGWPLTNLTDGGEGTPGRHVSDEERARMGERTRELWRRPKYRERVGPVFSNPERARQRARQRWQDPVYAAAQRAVLLAAGARGAAGRRGINSFMKRDDVRERHREAMQAIGRRKRLKRTSRSLALVRAVLAPILLQTAGF